MCSRHPGRESTVGTNLLAVYSVEESHEVLSSSWDCDFSEFSKSSSAASVPSVKLSSFSTSLSGK